MKSCKVFICNIIITTQFYVISKTCMCSSEKYRSRLMHDAKPKSGKK